MLLDGFPTAPQVEPISGLLGAHLHPGLSVPLLLELLFGRKEETLRLVSQALVESQDMMLVMLSVHYVVTLAVSHFVHHQVHLKAAAQATCWKRRAGKYAPVH